MRNWAYEIKSKWRKNDGKWGVLRTRSKESEEKM